MWNTKESAKNMRDFANEQLKLALEAKKRQEEAAKPENILDALVKRCVETKPHPDLRTHACHCAWWSICQHCTWM